MNSIRDFDTMMYGQYGISGVEHRLHLTDFSFWEAIRPKRPFAAKIRHTLHTLTHLSHIRIHITLELRESVVGKNR